MKWQQAKQNAAYSITPCLYHAGLKRLYDWPSFVAGRLFSTGRIRFPSLGCTMSLEASTFFKKRVLYTDHKAAS